MKNNNLKIAIGLMSGTSMDGIDAALVESDGLQHVRILSSFSHSYDKAFQKQLSLGLNAAKAIVNRLDRPFDLAAIEEYLTHEHVKVVKALLVKAQYNAKDVDIIGFHGQTVLHRPQCSLTVQLGDGPLLARETGIDVIYDMRANDMAYGGQGAPLVPIYHAALAALRKDYIQFPVAFVNIGGISNLTYIKTTDLSADNNIIAFDCGPGNVLIDQWMVSRANKAFDQYGSRGLVGSVNFDIINNIIKDKVFCRDKPQSLDWKEFIPLVNNALSIEDGAATLAYLTAMQIFSSFKFLPTYPKDLVISGGGVKNQAIMKYLQILAQKSSIKLHSANDIGLNATFMEAEAWGYLAIRSLKKMPLTFPQTTGCKIAVTGGVLASCRNL